MEVNLKVCGQENQKEQPMERPAPGRLCALTESIMNITGLGHFSSCILNGHSSIDAL